MKSYRFSELLTKNDLHNTLAFNFSTCNFVLKKQQNESMYSQNNEDSKLLVLWSQADAEDACCFAPYQMKQRPFLTTSEDNLQRITTNEAIASSYPLNTPFSKMKPFCASMIERMENVTTKATTTEITLAPNPTGHSSELNFSTDEPMTFYLNLYNTLGQLVKSTKDTSTSGMNSYKIDLDDFAAGIYFVELAFPNERHTLKLIKMKE